MARSCRVTPLARFAAVEKTSPMICCAACDFGKNYISGAVKVALLETLQERFPGGVLASAFA